MTFSFSGTGQSREEALRNFRKGADECPHVPKPLIDDIVGAAVTLTWSVEEDMAMNVSCSGHFNTTGTGSISLSMSVFEPNPAPVNAITLPTTLNAITEPCPA